MASLPRSQGVSLREVLLLNTTLILICLRPVSQDLRPLYVLDAFHSILECIFQGRTWAVRALYVLISFLLYMKVMYTPFTCHVSSSAVRSSASKSCTCYLHSPAVRSSACKACTCHVQSTAVYESFFFFRTRFYSIIIIIGVL